jgi:hypothetical protein
MTFQKPLPTESIHKHLQMLANYCKEMADRPKPTRAERREKAFADTWRKLHELANSRAVKTLLDYGE